MLTLLFIARSVLHSSLGSSLRILHLQDKKVWFCARNTLQRCVQLSSVPAALAGPGQAHDK